MILCVDPDADARAATADALVDAGFEVRDCASASSAEDVLADEGDAVECLVSEYDLPDGTGLDLFRAVRETAPDATCVLFTSTPLDGVDTAAFGDVVAEYLPKDEPNAREELVSVVEHGFVFGDQTAYPLPNDEAERREALDRYAVEEDELAAALDRLTELAVDLFDAHSAAVGILDAHHERFVGCHGISLDTTTREDTVCTYAILDDGVTVIEDLTTDPRFGTLDVFDESPIRAYAGAPMRTPEGRAIGVFCVYDDRVRTFSDRERHLLRLLGDEAMDQLELRRRRTESAADE